MQCHNFFLLKTIGLQKKNLSIVQLFEHGISLAFCVDSGTPYYYIKQCQWKGPFTFRTRFIKISTLDFKRWTDVRGEDVAPWPSVLPPMVLVSRKPGFGKHIDALEFLRPSVIFALFWTYILNPEKGISSLSEYSAQEPLRPIPDHSDSDLCIL